MLRKQRVHFFLQMHQTMTEVSTASGVGGGWFHDRERARRIHSMAPHFQLFCTSTITSKRKRTIIIDRRIVFFVNARMNFDGPHTKPECLFCALQPPRHQQGATKLDANYDSHAFGFDAPGCKTMEGAWSCSLSHAIIPARATRCAPDLVTVSNMYSLLNTCPRHLHSQKRGVLQHQGIGKKH